MTSSNSPSPYTVAQQLVDAEKAAREDSYRELSGQLTDALREIADLRAQVPTSPFAVVADQLAKLARDVADLTHTIRSDVTLGTTYSGTGMQVGSDAITELDGAKLTGSVAGTLLTGAVQADAAGNATVGTGGLAATATDGFVYIPQIAGAPVGVPTAKAGYSPAMFDPVANIHYIWDGAVWQAH